jgi:hypothetical protein
VRIVGSSVVTGLVMGEGRITGVHVTEGDAGTEESVAADLVVDAAGRGSRARLAARAWLPRTADVGGTHGRGLREPPLPARAPSPGRAHRGRYRRLPRPPSRRGGDPPGRRPVRRPALRHPGGRSAHRRRGHAGLRREPSCHRRRRCPPLGQAAG